MRGIVFAVVAAELFNYLPAFPLATVADILGIREELHRPFVRFRGAMTKAARSLEAAPFGTSFRSEVEYLYREEVAPAQLEIREAVGANTYLPQLLGESAKDVPKWLGSAFVALAVSPWTHIPAVACVGAAAAVPSHRLLANSRAANHTSESVLPPVRNGPTSEFVKMVPHADDLRQSPITHAA